MTNKRKEPKGIISISALLWCLLLLTSKQPKASLLCAEDRVRSMEFHLTMGMGARHQGDRGAPPGPPLAGAGPSCPAVTAAGSRPCSSCALSRDCCLPGSHTLAKQIILGLSQQDLALSPAMPDAVSLPLSLAVAMGVNCLLWVIWAAVVLRSSSPWNLWYLREGLGYSMYCLQ